MSNQFSMKPSTKPLKGLMVSSNFGTFDTLTATNLQLESINIAGLFEDGIFQNVVIKDSQIFNTVIGAETPNVGFFTDLYANNNVKFISNNFGSYVEWDPTTQTFNINNSSLRVNACSFLGNLQICQNFIRATNLDGGINLFPNGLGSINIWGPTHISTSTGSFYAELTSGGSTLLAKENIIFGSSEGSATTTTYDKQTLTTQNGDIELATGTTRNINVSGIVTTLGNTLISTFNHHLLKSGDVITLSSAGGLSGTYTVGTLYTTQRFGIIPNITTASTITTGSYTKIPNTSIILNTETFVKIPTNTRLTFGTTSNSISGNTGSLLITSNGDTVLSVPTSHSVIIPDTTRIQFSGAIGTSGTLGVSSGGVTSNYTTTGNWINYTGTGTNTTSGGTGGWTAGSLNVVSTDRTYFTGPLTQIDTTNTRFSDPILTIADYTTHSVDNKDRGIEFRYYDSSSGSMKLGWFGYKVDSNKFTLIPDAVNINERIFGNAGRFDIGDISTTSITINSAGTLDANCGSIINVRNIVGCGGVINVNASSSLNITGGSRISLISNGDIYIPNNIPITLGTSGSEIREGTAGNVMITGSRNIRLLTTTRGAVIVPVESYISFDGTSIGSQRVSANTAGDLTITSNRNVFMTLTSGNFILFPNNSGVSTASNIQFGNRSEIVWGNTAGINLLTSSSSGTLNAIASSNVNVSSSLGNVVLSALAGDINLFSTTGNVRLLPTTRLVFDITGTSNSIRYDSQDLIINGGVSNNVTVRNVSGINLGASAEVNITTGTRLNLASDRTRSLVTDTSGNFYISNTTTTGAVVISSGSGTSGTVVVSSGTTIINGGSVGGVLNVINNSTTISSNTITITGATGSSLIVNTQNVQLQDPIVSLANYALVQNDFKDRGVEYNYRLTTVGNLKSGWFGWKNSSGRFTYYSDATNTGEIISGTVGDAEFGNLHLGGGVIFSGTGGSQIDMNCGNIINLNTIRGCSGVVNVIGTNSVNVTASNIMLGASSHVQIPANVPLAFGSTSNSISADTGGTITITALGGSGTVVLNSNVQINGTTSNIYSTVTNIQDPIFSLGGVIGPLVNDNKDRGIEFKWNTSSGTSGSRTGFFGYKNNLGRFVFIQSGTNVDEVYSGSFGNVQFGDGFFRALDLANGTISNVSTISGGRVDIVATGSGINLSAGNVLLGYDSKLAFGTTNNAISAGTGGTLSIVSQEDISLVTPTSGNGSVRISDNTPLYFGSDNSNYIVRNTANNLQVVNNVGDIELYPKTGGNVLIPTLAYLGFGSTSNSIVSNGQELVINGYQGVSINTTTFTISGDVNVLGKINAGVTADVDINTYILPLGTSQILNVTGVENYNTLGEILITTEQPHNLNVGNEVSFKNTTSIPVIKGAFNISSIVGPNKFVIPYSGGISTPGGIGGTVTTPLISFQGKDVGIQVNYWTTSGNVGLTVGSAGYKTGFFGFKLATERWTYYKNATISNSIVTGDLSDIEVNKVFANRIGGFVLDGGITAGSNAIAGSNFQISGGSINGTPIGVNTAQTGRFTNLSNTVSANFSNVTMTSSLAYTFERYTLSSAGLQTRNPSTSFVISLFTVTGPNYTGSSGTMPSNSNNIPDGTFKILVCGGMGIGSNHTIYFGPNKLITPNPLNVLENATRLTFKRQGQSAQLVFDAQGNNGEGSWILLSNGVYVS